MVSVPTSLGEWIDPPWFDLGLVVWKGYRPRVRLVLAGGHASAWFSPFWRGPAPGAQRYQAVSSGLLGSPLLGTRTRAAADWCHAWSLLGQWSGWVTFPVPATGEWPRHGHLRGIFVEKASCTDLRSDLTLHQNSYRTTQADAYVNHAHQIQAQSVNSQT